MSQAAKRKAAQKWLAAALKKRMIPLIGEEMEKPVSDERLKAIIFEVMSEATPWMRDLLGDEFKPENAREFFELAIEEHDRNG